MDLSTSSIKSTIISFGSLLGAISVIFQLMLYFLDMHYKNDSTAGIVSLIIMAGIIYYSLIQFSDNMGYFFSIQFYLNNLLLMQMNLLFFLIQLFCYYYNQLHNFELFLA